MGCHTLPFVKCFTVLCCITTLTRLSVKYSLNISNAHRTGLHFSLVIRYSLSTTFSIRNACAISRLSCANLASNSHALASTLAIFTVSSACTQNTKTFQRWHRCSSNDTDTTGTLWR